MKKNTHTKVKGLITLKCHDKVGNLKWKKTFHNLITNGGLAQLALLGAVTPFIAVGSSNTAPAVTQTTLGSEITTNGLGRASATITRTTTNVANDTSNATTIFNVTGGSTIEEIGLFTASSAGVMIGRALSGSKAMLSGDQLTVDYQIIFV